MKETTELIAKAKKIKLVIFDVDGVLTDGKLYLAEDGNEHKAFYVRDGLGLVLLKQFGFTVAVITGRSSKIVADRMTSLGIEYLYQGQDNKYKALKDLADKLNIPMDEIAYLGDDLIDLPAMNHVGLAVAVNDAHDYVKQNSHAITDKKGGRGAARELAEFILTAQDKMETVLKQYS